MLKVVWVVVALFPISEIALGILKRSRADGAQPTDRGSMRLLWLVISGSVAGAILLQGVRATRIPLHRETCAWLGLGLLVGGLAIRWAAIITLGRLFTVDVAVQSGHSLVNSGLYRFVRHPSYAGLLVAFCGLGVLFANWLSLGLLIIPIGLAVGYRIRVEEAALSTALGPPYAAYCQRTKRLVPGVY